MHKHLLTAIVLSAISGTATAVSSGDDGDKAAPALAATSMPSFETVDTNQDGRITADEAKQVPGLSVEDADDDGDGGLSRTEYDALAEKRSKG